MRWYQLAAEQGDTNGQFHLGSVYAAGRGVPMDYVLAHMWFNLAASRETGEAREGSVAGRDLLAESMTPEQIVEAERLAREWDAAHSREP